MAADPASVMLFGAPKVGKTHWALFNMPSPVYVADTDKRSGHIAVKATAAGKEIYRKACINMGDVRNVVAAALKAADGVDAPGTFVFDGASDLLDLAQDEYLRETQADKIYPKVVWARVYRKIDKLIEALQRRGFFVVYLCREHAEYVGDQPTGRVTHEGYKRLPFKSDVVMRHCKDKLAVASCGFSRKPPTVVDVNLPWGQLYELLSTEQEEKSNG